MNKPSFKESLITYYDLMAKYQPERIHRFARSFEEGGCAAHFSALELDAEMDADMWKTIHDKYLFMDITTIRIHRFEEEDYIEQHIDSAYAGKSSLILRLDNNPQNRLIIEDTLVEEKQPRLLRPNTWHAIIPGRGVRYTLCAWGDRVIAGL